VLSEVSEENNKDEESKKPDVTKADEE